MIGFDCLFYNLLREISLIFLSFPTALPDTKKSIWSWRIVLEVVHSSIYREINNHFNFCLRCYFISCQQWLFLRLRLLLPLRLVLFLGNIMIYRHVYVKQKRSLKHTPPECACLASGGSTDPF